MEEIIAMIYGGCKLARDLELNLPNLANQPDILWKNCYEIVRIFSETRERINAEFSGGNQSENSSSSAGAMQQWLPRLLEQRALMEGLLMVPSEMAAGGNGVQPLDQLADSVGGSTFQRIRRRKDDGDKRTVRLAAPLMGNTEIPPDDGFTWRKYGQKEILGSRFPRAYYRCTHQKLYQCPAKKQVQRLDDDPFTFEVIYRGDHICTISSTAPSMSVITQVPAPTLTSSSSGQLAQSTTIPAVSHWLSMDIRTQSTDAAATATATTATTATTTTTAFVDMHMFNLGDGGTSSSSAAGPSTVPFGRDVGDQYYQPVVEFADVMFNTGSSSNSNMDLIFSQALEDHNRWDTTRDKQN